MAQHECGPGRPGPAGDTTAPGPAGDSIASALLAGAVSYALKAAALVGPADLPRPTPCPGWNVGQLICHLAGSMAAVEEAIAAGAMDGEGIGTEAIGAEPPGAGPSCGAPSCGAPSCGAPSCGAPSCGAPPDAGEPVELLRDCAASLLWTAFTTSHPVIWIGGIPVPYEFVVSAAAVEAAVHGWDISVGCGRGRAIPASLAGPMIRLLPRLVPGRGGLFSTPVAVPRCASPGDRLVAFLGRDPSERHRTFPTLVTDE
jgi:hypothetical protein